jgi:hypothetical protein
MLRGEQYVTVGGYLTTTLASWTQHNAVCAKSSPLWKPGHPIVLLWSAAAEGEGNEPGDAAFAEPESRDRIFPRVSRCARTCSSRSAPEEKRCRRLVPRLCHRTPYSFESQFDVSRDADHFARDSGINVLTSPWAREFCAPRVHVMLRGFPHALAKWPVVSAHAT